tara:strand:+ start:38 stop:226 length:189 start_codon:yes stop_codon:yes gene_type:complete
MSALSASNDTLLLLQTLEEKITLLISKNLVNSLEITQLQKENARLIAQLGEEDISTVKLFHP